MEKQPALVFKFKQKDKENHKLVSRVVKKYLKKNKIVPSEIEVKDLEGDFESGRFSVLIYTK